MSAAPAGGLAPGFADPVHDAQGCFRAVLSAMARPGTVVPVTADLAPPALLSGGCAAVLLTLCDLDTPVWLDPALARPDIGQWIAFHTGAPLVDDRGTAAFAAIGAPATLQEIDGFPIGTEDFPDRSATLILQVDGFDGAEGPDLTGPGIATSSRLSPTPLPPGFWDSMRANAAGFPLGVDVVFAAPAAVAALPRSVRIGG